MTYGVQRMTFTGNTLCDKLKAEFGERSAAYINAGREANAKRAAREAHPQRPAAKRSVKQATAENARRPAGHMSDTREFAAVRNASVTRREVYSGDRYANRAEAARQPRTAGPARVSSGTARATVAYAENIRTASNTRPAQGTQAANARPAQSRRPNIMRDTVVHRMAKPQTDKTPLEISVATFSTAYRRGEKVREYAAAERSKPHARNTDYAKAEKRSPVVRAVSALRRFIFGEKRHAEVKIKKTPFPVSMIALLAVCTVMVMVMMNSFAQLYEYRSEISQLETQQKELASEETRLRGLVEAKEDVRLVEQVATEELGMVSSDLAKSRFVSLSSEDRVEIKNTPSGEETGAFSTLLSAIGENLGTLSEYFN